MARTLEVILLGLGGMGSATAWRLAKVGARVRAFDPRPIGHALGSSHGEARMIRQAYFEHPDYVPLLKSAYGLWSELEKESGRNLFHRSGVIIYGPSQGSAILPGVSESARIHGLHIEPMSRAEVLRRYPEYRPPSGFEAILEPNAGYLEVENAVTEAARLAAGAGAELHLGEGVRSWKANPDGRVEVTTDRDTYRADRLVITAGPWSAPLLGEEIGKRLDVRRVAQFWYQAQVTQKSRNGSPLPCFGFELPTGFFYGFPLPGSTFKMALHRPGDAVSNPDHVDRELRREDVATIEAFNQECLSEAVTDQMLHQSVCMYTMTPDQHFVIDQHPQHPNVVFAAGFSGHGFKFAPVIGEILSDLALKGETGHPIDFLRIR